MSFPTDRGPDFDLQLTDGTTTLGFVITNQDGNPDVTQLTEVPQEATAIKTTSGESKYSDLDAPYSTIIQSDWSGGRGNLYFEDDKSKYYDSYRMNTENEGKLFTGGMEIFGECTNYSLGNMPGLLNSINGLSLTRHLPVSVDNKMAVSFTCPTGITAISELYFIVSLYTPTDDFLTVYLYSDSGGSPNASVATLGTIKKAQTDNSQVPPATGNTYLKYANRWTEVVKLIPDTHTIVAGTSYWIVIDYNASRTTASHVKVTTSSTTANTGISHTQGVYKGWSGSAWSTSITYAKPFNYHINFDAERSKTIFFKYRGAEYAVVNYADGSNSKVFRNGYVGLASSNSANKAKLIPGATHTWIADELIGCHVKLVAGTGSTEEKTWRRVSDNAADDLTVDDDWIITHDTTTEYVVSKNNWWQYINTFTGPVTDVAVAGGWVYLARGTSNAVLRMSRAGSTETFTAETYAKADQLLLIRHPEDDTQTLYGSYNGDTILGNYIWKYTVPPTESDLYTEVGVFLPTDSPALYDTKRDYISSYVTASRVDNSGPRLMHIMTPEGSSFSYTPGGLSHIRVPAGTGLVFPEGSIQNYGYLRLTLNGTVPTDGIMTWIGPFEPVDLSKGSHIAYLAKASATQANLKMSLGDTPLLLPNLYNFGTGYAIIGKMNPKVYYWNNKGIEFTELYYCTDGDSTSCDAITLDAATDGILIGCTHKFNAITFDLGAGLNAIASAVSASYKTVTGLWQAISNVSDGTKTGTTSWSQDGDISWPDTPDDWVPHDINGDTLYWIMLSWSVAMDATDVNEITCFNNAEIKNLTMPSVTTSWTFHRIALAPARKWPDFTRIQSAAIYQNKATYSASSETVDFAGGILLISSQPKVIRMPTKDRITGMIAYTSDVSETRKNPWIFTEAGLFEVQTQYDDKVVEVPIGELDKLLSETTGRYSVTSNVYIYLSLQKLVERYYGRSLENIGPERGEGLYIDRLGNIVGLENYPGGRVFAALDAGSNGISSIQLLKGSAVHQFYVAPAAARILGMGIESYDGMMTNIIWAGVGCSFVGTYYSLQPLTDKDYDFAYDGWLITSKFTGGLLDVDKSYFSVVIHKNWYKRWAEYEAGASVFEGTHPMWLYYSYYGPSNQYTVIYGSEADADGGYYGAPITEKNLSSSTPFDVRGKFLQLAIYSVPTDDNSIAYRKNTDEINAIGVKCFAVAPVKYSWSFTGIARTDKQTPTLSGGESQPFDYNTGTTMDDCLDVLKNWANTGRLLYATSSRISTMSNVYVVINPPALRWSKADAWNSVEEAFVQMRILQA